MTLGVFFRLKLSLPRWMGRLNHLKPNVYGCWRSVEPGGMITFLYYNEELWIWSPRRHCPFKIFWVRSAYDSISLRLLKTDGWNLRITSVKGNISYKHPFLLGFLSSFLCVYHIYIYIYNFTNYNKKKNSNADKKYIYNIYIIYIDKLWRGSRTRWHHPFCQFPLQGNMWNLRFDELESRNLENQQGFVQSGDLSWIELLRTIKLMVDLGVDIDQVTGNFSSLYTCF